MSKKRDLKKFVRNLAEGVVVAVLPAAVHLNRLTEQRADEIIGEISVAQTRTLARLSAVFDRRQSEFATKADFRKAKAAYCRQLCVKARQEFVARMQAILDEVNKAKK